MESMEIDVPNKKDRKIRGITENGLHLYPVSGGDSGDGLPYAPIDWPNRGDKWSWKVGRRIASSGYFADRLLFPPSRLRQDPQKKCNFRSILSVEQYLRAEFPGVDVKGFFASFSWKIPSEKLFETKGNDDEPKAFSERIEKQSGSGFELGALSCKAGNKMCSSLLGPQYPPLKAMACDICCSENGFCRDCCCIICCKIIDLARSDYDCFKCEATVCERGLVCGHSAHIDCALLSYLAGNLGGNIGLDAEYYCRRCDSRTDLVLHVQNLLQIHEFNESRDDVEKILNIGISVLRGSRKTSAKTLLHRSESAMAKLKSGTHLKDIWKVEDTSTLAAGGFSHRKSDALEVTVTDHEKPQDLPTSSPQIVSGKFDHQTESLKLENEIDKVLQELRKSQESEYRMAEERLSSQKNYLLNLYQRLDKEKSELSRRTSSVNPDELLDTVLTRVGETKREVVKLKDMEEIAKGFGKTSKDVLKEHFGLNMER